MLIGVMRNSQPAVADFVKEVKGRQPNGAGRCDPCSGIHTRALADPNIFSNAIEVGERLKIDAATERLVRGSSALNASWDHV